MEMKVANMKVPRLILLSLFLGSILSCVGLSYLTENKAKEYVKELSYFNDLKRYVLDLDNVHNQLEILKPQLTQNKTEATKQTLAALSKRRDDLGKQLKSFVREPEYVRFALQIENLSQSTFAYYLTDKNLSKKVAEKGAKPKSDREIASEKAKDLSLYHDTTKKMIENINGILIFKSAARSKYISVYNMLNLVFSLLASACALIIIKRLFRAEQLLQLKKIRSN